MKFVRTRIAVALLAVTVQVAAASPALARTNDRDVIDPIIRRIAKVIKAITGITIATLEENITPPKP